MKRLTPAWFDQQYNARAAIPEHPAILQSWFERSAQARSSLRCTLDLAYGTGVGETLDLFHPVTDAPAPPAPVLVYLHGGYWRALDKRDQSFVATPFVQAGALVVLPNYALAPAVSVRHIVLQLVQALAWVHRHAASHGGDPKRIVVAGHSAGGHLAAMMLACRWQQVAADLPGDLVQDALAVSGLFELEPLRHAPFLKNDLELSAAEARHLSPAAMPAPTRGRLWTSVGAQESAEFQRQQTLIACAWGRQVVSVRHSEPDCHHMSVLHTLADPTRRTCQMALELLGLRGPETGGGD